MQTYDQLHRFLFRDASVRGELVRLQESLGGIVHSTEYPVIVQALLADMASAVSLLTATLKIDGEVSLQIQGEGVVNYAVVSASNNQTIRGVARWNDAAETLPDTFAELVKKSYLVITITPDDGERYQGVVALDQPSLAACLESYFQQSEQLATKVLLMNDFSDLNAPKAAGILLQVIPTSSEATNVSEAEDFEHLSQLAQTITSDEVFSLAVEDVLYRLFHQEEVELYPAQVVTFGCTCSKERSAQALQNVDKMELLNIIDEEGAINMTCQYCHTEYSFDAIDVESIHAGNFASTDTEQ